MDQWVRSMQQQTQYRPPHYHPTFPLILLWSPKAGCTTFAKWFYYQIGQLDIALRHSRWIHDYEFTVYKRVPNYAGTVLHELQQRRRPVIKLVRNPYRRAVSSFFALVMRDSGLFQQERAAILSHPAAARLPGQGVTFRKYLTYLLHAGADASQVNSHFARQYIAGEEHYIDRFIRLERLGEELRDIERVYGLRRSDVAALSESLHHLSPRMRTTGFYADADIRLGFDASAYPAVSGFYDEGTRALVRHVFRQDFETYGYDMTRIES